MSGAFNVFIDNLSEACRRIIELPFFLLLPLVVIAFGLIALPVARFADSRGRRRKVIWVATLSLLFALFLGGYVIDGEMTHLRNLVRGLRYTQLSSEAQLLKVLRGQGIKHRQPLVDASAAQEYLSEHLQELNLLRFASDDATDVVLVRSRSPLVQAYVVIVDLELPGVEICIGTNTDVKSQIFDFARERECSVAINGEAGRSPGPDCGFGNHIGNLVADGRVYLLEDTDKRPFLTFDQENRATYSEASEVRREMEPHWHNVIWGREDAVVEGVVKTEDWRGRQPRTLMGIDKAGKRLYLAVVDGRQPGHSMGLTRAEGGHLLKAFGAHNGMFCDEGGSSCIFIEKLGGIANIPCDSLGTVRPTYTHFGLRYRAQ